MKISLFILFFLTKVATAFASPLTEHYEHQIRFYQNLLDRDPFSKIAREKIAENKLSLARATGNISEYEAAEKLLSEIKDPSPYQRVLYARSIMAAHRFKEAEKMASELLKTVSPKEPIYIDILNLRADALIDLGNIQAAKIDIEKSYELKPDFNSTARLANLKGKLGDKDSELSLLKKAELLVPKHDPEAVAWARFRIGLFYFNHKMKDQALTAFNETLNFAPDFNPALIYKKKLERGVDLGTEAHSHVH